jgi:type VI secretion system Hcp family effector
VVAGERTRRIWKSALLVAVGAAGGGAAFAVASVPGSDGVIHACYAIDRTGNPVVTISGSNLRIIDPSKGQTCDTTTGGDGQPAQEANLTWNQRGATGPQGPRGARGRAITIAGGNVITIGGTPVTVGSSRGVTINTPPLARGSKPIGTLTLDLGHSKLSAPIFSYSLATAAHGGGGGAGRVATHEIVITKHMDKASPKLAQFCATGKHIVRGTITLRKAGKGQQEFLVIKLDTVLISSYQTGGKGSGETTPTESLSLNFTKIQFDHKQ